MAAIISAFPGTRDDLGTGAIGGRADDGEGNVGRCPRCRATRIGVSRRIETPGRATLNSFVGRANEPEGTRGGLVDREKGGALLDLAVGRHGDGDRIGARTDGTTGGRILAAAKCGWGCNCADEAVGELAQIGDIADASICHQHGLRAQAGTVDHLLRLRVDSTHRQQGGHTEE